MTGVFRNGVDLAAICVVAVGVVVTLVLLVGALVAAGAAGDC